MRLNSLVVITAMAISSTGAIAQTSRLDRIKQTGTITIGHRETAAPMSFLSTKGEVGGYSIDICQQVVKDLSAQLSVPTLQVRYVPITPQTRIPLMANGTVDIECGNTTPTLSRMGQVDFSVPIFVDGVRLAVQRDAKDVTSLSDLAGKSVGVTQGALEEKELRKRIEQEKIPGVRLALFPNEGEGLLALGTGRLDAFCSNTTVLIAEMAKSRFKDQLRITGEKVRLQLGLVAIMVPRNDADLRLAVNRTLARLYRSGEIDGIFKKWFSPLGVEKDQLNQANFDIGALDD
jgi:glutamate/aspartate transport system substrate-binding protein